MILLRKRTNKIAAQRRWLCAGLLLLILACLAANSVLLRPASYDHPDQAATLNFWRSSVSTAPFLVSMGGSLVLLWLTALWCRRREAGRWAALGALVVSIIGHQALLVSAIWWGLANWEVQDYVRSRSGSTYYFLHRPPPLHGAGDYVVARRTSATPFSYSVRTVGRLGRDGKFQPFPGSNPEAATVAQELWTNWTSGKQHAP